MEKRIFTAEDILGKRTTTEEALEQLAMNKELYQNFCALDQMYKDAICEFMAGIRGIPIQFDPVFKKVFDPDIHPERLEDLISSVLGEKIKIDHVLPNSGNQLVDQGTFVVMDVVAMLEDGSLINAEMQKIGYQFPAQRTSCYMSDLIMRQYNRVHAERGKHFKYSDIKKTYMFIILVNSSSEFKSVPGKYIHRRIETYDSGISLPKTEVITYVTLDTFLESGQNISNRTDAWLTFLSKEDESSIVELVNKYPDFLPLYQEIREFRRKPEEVLNMFSEALYILDKNTERFMVDELKNEVDEKDRQLRDKDQIIAEKDAEIERLKQALKEQ